MRRAYTGRMGFVHALPLRIAILVATVLGALMALPGCVAPAGDIIAGVRASAAHDSFNIAVWELRHASDIVAALNTPPENPDAIDEYFETSARLREAAWAGQSLCWQTGPRAIRNCLRRLKKRKPLRAIWKRSVRGRPWRCAD